MPTGPNPARGGLLRGDSEEEAHLLLVPSSSTLQPAPHRSRHLCRFGGVYLGAWPTASFLWGLSSGSCFFSAWVAVLSVHTNSQAAGAPQRQRGTELPRNPGPQVPFPCLGKCRLSHVAPLVQCRPSHAVAQLWSQAWRRCGDSSPERLSPQGGAQAALDGERWAFAGSDGAEVAEESRTCAGPHPLGTPGWGPCIAVMPQLSTQPSLMFSSVALSSGFELEFFLHFCL